MSETRYVEDGHDGHGHPRFVEVPEELLPAQRGEADDMTPEERQRRILAELANLQGKAVAG